MKNLQIIFLLLFFANTATAQWEPQTSGTTQTLRSVFFTDMNTGYAVGDSGTILKTINAGSTWSVLSSGTNYYLNSVHFPASNIGYAVGDGWNGSNNEGIILKTNDGGTTWTANFISIGSDVYISDVFFTDIITGYTSCSKHIIDMTYSPFIEKTTDGGTTWTYLPFGVPSWYIRSIFFTDANKGYGVGIASHSGQALIIKTIDGGTTWTSFFPASVLSLRSVFFTDPYTGYAVGGNGAILKTIDGGTNWIALSSGTNYDLESVHFPAAYRGYSVGYNYTDSVGTIIKTIDGGTTWMELSSGATNHLYSVYFTNAETGYVVGENGTILKTNNGGGYPVGVNDHNQTSNTLTIYPNPTSGQIVIETPAKVHFSILNLNGKELLKQNIFECKTQINISNLPAGIYIVRLMNERVVQVGKVIKW